MVEYAEILSGVIRYIGSAPKLPVFSGDLLAVNISNVSPKPDIGWLYEKGIFSSPPPPKPLTPDPDKLLAASLSKTSGEFTSGELATIFRLLLRKLYNL